MSIFDFSANDFSCGFENTTNPKMTVKTRRRSLQLKQCTSFNRRMKVSAFITLLFKLHIIAFKSFQIWPHLFNYMCLTITSIFIYLFFKKFDWLIEWFIEEFILCLQMLLYWTWNFPLPFCFETCYIDEYNAYGCQKYTEMLCSLGHCTLPTDGPQWFIGFMDNIQFPITQITSSDDVILTQMSIISESLLQRQAIACSLNSRWCFSLQLSLPHQP